MIDANESLALILANWELFARRMPGGTVQRGDGVTSLFANQPLQFLNVSVLDTPTPDQRGFRRAIETATQRAATCSHPSFIALSKSWVPSDWHKAVMEMGWEPAVELTAMDCDALLPPRRAAPELAFERVANVAVATDLAIINAHAYGLPVELFECMFNLHLWHADSFGYTGKVLGEAVTAAAIFPLAGTAYAAFVATLPARQGKGYAEAALRHAIAEHASAVGRTRITLHATDLGKPVYLRMGFVPGDQAVLLSRSGSHP